MKDECNHDRAKYKTGNNDCTCWVCPDCGKEEICLNCEFYNKEK